MQNGKHDLTHYGIKGMRWGFRKDRGSSGRNTSPEHDASRKSLKKGAKRLSNAELQEVTKRLQLERNFKQETAKRHPMTKARNLTKGLLATTTTLSSLYAFSKSPLGKEIAKSLQKKVAEGRPTINPMDLDYVI